ITLFLDKENENYPIELALAHQIWNHIYNPERKIYLSHTEQVKRFIKKRAIPQNERLIQRISSITTPLRLKTDDWKSFKETGKD
ncbi:MAG: hypothetical protein KBT36_00040, partial [Kurthia sp.]|nr:hypothetical protein [Candidatus Kurthia equi]